MSRLLTAAVLITLVLLGIRWAPIWIFWLALSALALVAVQEMSTLLAGLGKRPWPALAMAGTVVTMGTFIWPEPPLIPVLTAFLIFSLLYLVLSRQQPSEGVEHLFGTIAVVLYLGLTLGHVGGLLAGELPAGREQGEDLLVFALVVVYFGDTFAFFGGRAFGRRKMAPQISPAKTWEGAGCGLLGALLGSLLGPFWFFQALPVSHALGLGALLGLAGILGDLCESYLKRAAEVKDSGRLLPGHGGVLDRIDSLLLAAPALYWYHRLIL